MVRPYNQENRFGTTPVMDAMEKGCDAILPTLFKRGALPDYENKNGITPLILATRLASKALIAALGRA